MHDQSEPTRTEKELVPEHQQEHGALPGAGHEEPALLPDEELDDA
jgi:hypothetical protein